MKKRGSLFSVLVAVILCLALLTGCSGGSKSSDAASGGYYTATNDYYSYDGAYYEEAWEEEAEYYEETGEDPDLTVETEEAINEANSESKLIYRANVDIETITYEETCQQIRDLTQQCGGYFENSETSNYGSYRNAYFTVRIPQEEYRNFVTSAGDLEMVVAFNESVENVSATYYDTQLRLESAKQELAAYQKLYEDATEVEDMIVITEAINSVQYNIDTLSGTLRYYDALVSYSTVEFSVSEVAQLRGQEEPAIGFGAQLKQAFRNGSQRFADNCRSLVLSVADCWTGWLIFLCIVALAVFFIRKAVKKSKANKVAKQQAMMEAAQNRYRIQPDYAQNDPVNPAAPTAQAAANGQTARAQENSKDPK